MKLFDSHAHLNFKDFYDDVEKVIKRSFDNGMEGIINVGSRYDNSELAVKQAQKNEKIYAAVGFHPDHLNEIEEKDVPDLVKKISNLAKDPNVVAIGEIGFDNHYYKIGVNEDTIANRSKEKLIATSLALMAADHDKPIIVHSREAEKETLELLQEYSAKSKKTGVVHCFTYSWEFAEKIIDLGFFIGFTGIITYPKTESLIDVVRKIPLDRVLIETDCPFLSPQATRGQKNEPLFVEEVAKKIAEIKDLELEEVVEVTCQNAKRLFNIT